MTRFAYLLVALVVSGLTAIPLAVQASSFQAQSVASEATSTPNESDRAEKSRPMPAWEACASCHKQEGHNHVGECKSCHIGEVSPQSAEHPVFEPITDGTCAGCHVERSLP